MVKVRYSPVETTVVRIRDGLPRLLVIRTRVNGFGESVVREDGKPLGESPLHIELKSVVVGIVAGLDQSHLAEVGIQRPARVGAQRRPGNIHTRIALA